MSNNLYPDKAGYFVTPDLFASDDGRYDCECLHIRNKNHPLRSHCFKCTVVFQDMFCLFYFMCKLFVNM